MTDTIVPPLDLQRALEAALSDVDGVRPRFTQAELQAEAILYSAPMQEWLWAQRAGRDEPATAKAEEPRDPITVNCSVRVPLDSPHTAADVLARVPINARIAYVQGQGIISGLLGVGTLDATWTEER